jgi:hypothetical protein
LAENDVIIRDERWQCMKITANSDKSEEEERIVILD